MRAVILPKLGMCKGGYEAADELMRMGAREIGSGHFARVFQMRVYEPPVMQFYDVNRMEHMFKPMVHTIEQINTVVKVVQKRDRGALLVARAAMATADLDPLAPRIAGIVEFADDTWAIELEHLNPLRDVVGGPSTLGITEKPKEDVPAWFTAPRTPLRSAIDASPFLSLLDQHVRKSNGYIWDIHGGNVMMRDAQPVVIDPIYHGADC